MFAVAWATMKTEASATRRALIRPDSCSKGLQYDGGRHAPWGRHRVR
jgi:hypothetical protein